MNDYKQRLDNKIDNVLDFVQHQLKRTATEIDEAKYPRSTIDGNRRWREVSSSDWTSGFYPGCLWYAYEMIGDAQLKQMAKKWTAGVEKEKYNTEGHDVGFMIFCSFGNGYRLTGEEDYKKVILTAAQSLAKRYNKKVGCTRSWSFGTWKFPVIIDNIMNLELLFWASKNGGDSKFYDMALRHAEVTLDNHLREDGGLYHLVDYNPETGEVLSKASEGNSDPNITWTRGQAWGIYGYAMAYRFTGQDRFIKASKLMADNFISNLSEDNIPYWVIGERMHKRDSSAAAIAASGLLELAEYVENLEDREKYIKAAVNILLALTSENYYSEGTESPSILLQGMGGDSEQDVGLIYSDYYFIEALIRYRRL